MIREHPRTLVSHTAERFGISRQAALRHVKRLRETGAIVTTGTGRKRRYELRRVWERVVEFDVTPATEDHVLWGGQFRPFLLDLPKPVLALCDYGVSEMINNVIDHSGSPRASLEVVRTVADLEIGVRDHGVGVFRKIQRSLNLEDERHAVLELSKGKLTTDPSRHTGQGIFFTSRMFDHFSILSGGLFLLHDQTEDDWLLETSREAGPGTVVHMRVRLDTARTTKWVFDQYSGGEDYAFDRTQVPLKLAKLGDDQLVSRSQARRVLARFEKFREVFLDFDGVDEVGQAFADEIFRVFRRQHPQIRLEWVRANRPVTQMIRRALADADIDQAGLFDPP